MKTLKLYHHPRCSKSRAALKILQDHGIDVEVIDYLQHPPTLSTLRILMRKLQDKPETLFRRQEEAYQAIASLPIEERLAAVVKNPRLLERPIVETQTQAIVARPVEKLIALMEAL